MGELRVGSISWRYFRDLNSLPHEGDHPPNVIFVDGTLAPLWKSKPHLQGLRLPVVWVDPRGALHLPPYDPSELPRATIPYPLRLGHINKIYRWVRTIWPIPFARLEIIVSPEVAPADLAGILSAFDGLHRELTFAHFEDPVVRVGMPGKRLLGIVKDGPS